MIPTCPYCPENKPLSKQDLAFAFHTKNHKRIIDEAYDRIAQL